MSIFSLVLKNPPPVHPAAMCPSRKNVGTSPMIAVPAVGWLTPISLYLFSLLLISLFRRLDDVFALDLSFSLPLSLSLSLTPSLPHLYIYIYVRR